MKTSLGRRVRLAIIMPRELNEKTGTVMWEQDELVRVQLDEPVFVSGEEIRDVFVTQLHIEAA